MSVSTISRTALRTSRRYCISPHLPAAHRSLSTSARHLGSGDVGPDRTHLHDKTHPTAPKTNVQASASQAAHKSRAEGGEDSQATSQKDHGKSNEKAKEEFPEAPGPVLGMNDERGGKGR